MKNQNAIAGIILLTAGVLLLLHNFNLLDLKWHVIIKFWPLVLIYGGLATMYNQKKGWIIPLIMLLVTLIAILLYWTFGHHHMQMGHTI